MSRHRINLVVKDPELDRIVSRFLRQRIPAAKRSVFECFLSQFLEDLWKRLGDDFISLVLRKAYEEPLMLPSDSSLMKKVLAEEKEKHREDKIPVPGVVSEKSVEQEKVSDEEDNISLDDFLL